MNKRKVNYIWHKVRVVRSWHFFVLAVAFGILSLYSLRQNNLTALRLLQQVNQVDQQNGDVESALNELRVYMYSHMNADLASDPNAIRPPIQLKYRYERLVEAEKARVASQAALTKVQAEQACGSDVPCQQRFISSRGQLEQIIPDSLYKFDFASPVWSPDRAGLSLLASALFSVLFVVRVVLGRWLKHSLSKHQ